MARWERIASRGNVQDRRSLGPVAVGGVGLGGVAIYLLFSILTGGEIDVGQVLSQLEQTRVVNQQEFNGEAFEGEDDYEVFAATVLGSTDEMWSELFRANGREYRKPTLVLFREATTSACGTATSAVGPHYCLVDDTIYLDETFFDELRNRFGARGGDVAEAYVIAHEVGHHVQNQLKITDKVHRNPTNEASIKLELQADCLAGLWAHSIRDAGVFMPGEIQEALDAAAAVGDDRIQEEVAGYINPETWTHGSSEQRVEWFNRGFETGETAACDTFSE